MIGSAEFCTQTKHALKLLRARDSFNLKRVRKFFRFIVEHKVSGTTPYHKTFFVGSKTAFAAPRDGQYSVIWYASCIVHDAIHQELFRRFKRLDEREIERWEVICCRLQMKCLKRIGGDARHLRMLEGALKTRYWEGERKY